jgi:hypothetical protein
MFHAHIPNACWGVPCRLLLSCHLFVFVVVVVVVVLGCLFFSRCILSLFSWNILWSNKKKKKKRKKSYL